MIVITHNIAFNEILRPNYGRWTILDLQQWMYLL